MLTLQTLAHISEWPWVYVFRDGKNQIIYIWKAKNIKKRVSQYFAPGSVRKQDMMTKATQVEFFDCQSEQESLVLEANMIKQHQPVYNRLLKWDNGYVYIKITNHKYPQVLLTRNRTNDWATYIWPKNNTQALKRLIQWLRQFLQYRGCKDTQFKHGELCNDYVFGLCKGRCVYAKIDAENAKKAEKAKSKNIIIASNEVKRSDEANHGKDDQWVASSWNIAPSQLLEQWRSVELENILHKASRLGFKIEKEP